jgi:hypothetical protein
MSQSHDSFAAAQDDVREKLFLKPSDPALDKKSRYQCKKVALFFRSAFGDINIANAVPYITGWASSPRRFENAENI